MINETAINIFKKIINESSSNEEEQYLNNYIQELLEKMMDETISYDEQSLLDNYINYLRDIMTNMDLVDRYDGIVFSKTNINMTEEQISKEKGNVKVMKLTNNHSGIILTSVILEVVITLGLVIGILVLALT